MENILKNLRKILFIIAFVCGYSTMFAQFSIIGPTTVNQLETHTYSITPSNFTSASWYTVGTTGSDSTFTINFINLNMSIVAVMVDDYYGNTIQTYKSVTVVASPTPITPTPTIQSSNCGNTVLARTDPPSGSGLTYYWQVSSSGTDTSNSSSTITKTSSGTQYLRARNTNGIWSNTYSSLNYTVIQPTTWYSDVDGDGLGDPNTSVSACNPPANYVDNGNDILCPLGYGSSENNGCPDYELSDENYIYTIRPQIESQTGPINGNYNFTYVGNIASSDLIEDVTYFDGLGRPKQRIGLRAGGNGEDIITHIGYDDSGRQDKDYLPYTDTTNRGFFRTGAEASTLSYYDGTKYEEDFPGMTTLDINPYSEKHLEASPLSRVLEQGSPGTAWALNETADTDPNNDDADHTIKFGHATNTEYDYVRRFGVSFPTVNTEVPQLVDEGYYLTGKLYKTTTKDENWRPSQVSFTEHTTEEYKDKLGRVVLKRTFDKQKWLDTYYVYDDYGNLTYVLPPKAVTLNTVPNPYYGDLGFSGDISSMLLTGGGYAEYVIWDTADGFSVAIEITGFTEGTALKSGKIADLDFSPYAPPLIDAVLGNIVSKDSNGNGNIVATVYTKDGDLYLNSTGAGLYTPNGSGNYYETMYADLSNYTANTIGSATLNGLCYQYRYDKRNRLVEKKIPGKGTTTDWEEIVYNKLDRPILTRDLNLKAQGKWLFTKHDAFGRVAYTGIMNSTSTRVNLQSTVDGHATQYETKNGFSTTIAGTPVYYGNGSYPQTISEVYTINYYDDYTFDGFTSMPSSVDGQPVINHNNDGSTQKLTKGLATASKVRVLGTNPVKWITTITGYDIKGRIIYIESVNGYLGRTEIIKSTLDFTGKVVKSVTGQALAGQYPTIAEDYYTYDHIGRLKKQTQAINGASTPEVIVENIYDELGQLTSKGVGGKNNQSRLQNVDFNYNIRGWLKQINNPTTLGNDLFTFKLNYNMPSHGAAALYNGNISETEWRTSNTDNTLKWYKYNYDAINRLTSGFDNALNFIEYIGYDKNGNINNLTRKGFNESNSTYGIMDQLSYTYAADSNQLIGVKDNASVSNGLKTFGFNDGNTTGNDYAYDSNGNMISDANKGITSVVYNHLNMPTKITVTGSNAGVMDYTYSADGIKLQKKKTQGGNVTTTDYAGNFVYENNVLKQITQPEGYIEPDGSGWQYVYRLTDIWGNTRITFADDDGNGSVNSSEIRREQNYYPFGMEHQGYNGSMYGVKNNLKTYQKQEFTEDLGLETHEWKFRVSDPAIGRFWQIDPLAEKYTYNSTYAFQENKMGMGTELEGKEIKEWWNQAVAGWDKLFGQPLRNEKKRQAEHVTVYGTPDRKQPEKNITGNYLGDAALTLLGGDVVINALNGNQKAKEKVLMNGMLLLMSPGSRQSSLIGKTESKLSTKVSNFVFRGDTRNPTQIFKEGFTSKGANFNLLDHTGGLIDDSGFISTSFSPNVARGFAGEEGFVFTINVPTNGFNINTKLGSQSPYPFELELAIPLEIPSFYIQGARQVGSDGKFIGPFIKKP